MLVVFGEECVALPVDGGMRQCGRYMARGAGRHELALAAAAALHELAVDDVCRSQLVASAPVEAHERRAYYDRDGEGRGLADDDDMYTWEVMIIGPDGTLYEGGM